MQITVCGWGQSGGKGEDIPPPLDVAERKQRRMMSVAAVHSLAATRRAAERAAWADLGDVGQVMGVGASAGDIRQLNRMVGASRQDGAFDPTSFGGAGLRACNPLYAFQLMNNFTLAHAAVALGIGGPNSAIFSRGPSTVFALQEAIALLREGRCTRCFAGGADAVSHPITRAKLHQDVSEAVADGAGVLALSLEDGPIRVAEVHFARSLSIDSMMQVDQVIDARTQPAEGARSVRDRFGVLQAAAPAFGWIMAGDTVKMGRRIAEQSAF